jgi:hypothetical protein
VAVTDYIAVQPIDICGTTPSTCAPINNLGQNYLTAAVGNVGSLDTLNGNINVTRAIFDQIGVDVTFLPAAAFNMGSFSTLAVDSCMPDGTDCQSSQFKTLTQQPGISGNPPPAIPPTSPLSPNPTTIDTFFVGGLSPPPSVGGTLYGLAWLDNNGVANASNSLFGLGARPDTLAHEIGHDLDLSHDTFGAGDPNNLMTAGNSRTLQPDPHAAIAGIGPGMGNGTTDQLLPAQQSQVLLSGFMNPIPLVNTPATGTDFNVSFVNGGRPNEKLDSLTLTAPAGFLFDPNTMLRSTNTGVSGSVANCGEGGCLAEVISFAGPTPFVAGDSLDYTLCVPGPDSCAAVPVGDLAGGTYTYLFETDLDGKPIELFQTTSELTVPGDLFSNSQELDRLFSNSQELDRLFSNSQEPDPLFPSQILNPSTFVGFSAEPCTIIAPATTCPPLQLEDAFPPQEDQPVPEPPAVLILLSALVGLGVAYRFSSRTRSSFEAGVA